MQQQDLTTPDRRSVMQVCGLISLGLVGVPALAACGSSDDTAEGGSTPTTPAAAPTTTDAAAGGAVLAKLADIPVGGAVVAKGADGKPIVLTQVTAGIVTAVAGICTHKGGSLGVQGTQLVCPLHGATFGLDGALVKGPATTPLAAIPIKIDGENVVPA